MIIFSAALRDPDTGKTRDVTIEIGPNTLLVRLGKGRARSEDGPHNACADFTERRTEIAAAAINAAEEAERPHVCPGCYAINDEAHASYCPDEAIERANEERRERHENGEEDLYQDEEPESQ